MPSSSLRAPVQELLNTFPAAPGGGEPRQRRADNVITVSSAARRIAFAYERFRNTLEPDEADVLRRKAIARILSRRLELDDHNDYAVATALLQELVRAHYIAGASQENVRRITQEIKYFRTVHEASRPYRGRASPKAGPEPLRTWFLQIAAVSLDRELWPRQREEALVQLFYHDTYHRAAWMDEVVAYSDRPAQLYIACHRALFASDNYEIAYHYFLRFIPGWKTDELNDGELKKLTDKLPGFYENIQSLLNHPARQRLVHLLRPLAVPYRIIRDLLDNPAAFPATAEAIPSAAEATLAARSQRLLLRIRRRAWHSVLFLLFTKTVLALLVELPYDLFLLGSLHPAPLIINIVLHPGLLFLLSTSVRLPGPANTKAVLEEVTTIITEPGPEKTVVITAPRRYGTITWAAFGIFYAALFVSIFWGLFTLLDRLHFSLVAIFLFVVFLGLVSFLAIRVRRSTDEVRALPKRDSALLALGTFLALPVLEFGSYLSRHISQINLLLFLLDRILEAPFKLFIDIFEEWLIFVRDRKEEIL